MGEQDQNQNRTGSIKIKPNTGLVQSLAAAHHNQSGRFLSSCPLQFRPLLVHQQVKAGSIIWKLISAKEFVFLQPEIDQD